MARGGKCVVYSGNTLLLVAIPLAAIIITIRFSVRGGEYSNLANNKTNNSITVQAILHSSLEVTTSTRKQKTKAVLSSTKTSTTKVMSTKTTRTSRTGISTKKTRKNTKKNRTSKIRTVTTTTTTVTTKVTTRKVVTKIITGTPFPPQHTIRSIHQPGILYNNPNIKLTASSFYSRNGRQCGPQCSIITQGGKIDGCYCDCWQSKSKKPPQWIQVDLGSKYDISHIGILGNSGSFNKYWVSKYRLAYKNGNGQMIDYQQKKELTGSEGAKDIAWINLNPQITTNVLRLIVTDYKRNICTRWELKGKKLAF